MYLYYILMQKVQRITWSNQTRSQEINVDVVNSKMNMSQLKKGVGEGVAWHWH
jgi:hypothetical protein